MFHDFTKFTTTKLETKTELQPPWQGMYKQSHQNDDWQQFYLGTAQHRNNDNVQARLAIRLYFVYQVDECT